MSWLFPSFSNCSPIFLKWDWALKKSLLTHHSLWLNIARNVFYSVLVKSVCRFIKATMWGAFRHRVGMLLFCIFRLETAQGLSRSHAGQTSDLGNVKRREQPIQDPKHALRQTDREGGGSMYATFQHTRTHTRSSRGSDTAGWECQTEGYNCGGRWLITADSDRFGSGVGGGGLQLWH